MNLDQLRGALVSAGAVKLFAKPLAENDNSKNQVYFGPGFGALNLIPTREIAATAESPNPIFKARLEFGWINEQGVVSPAPGAQLILYPQYPEVRFSGFLRGCKSAPSLLMNSRLRGRLLLLAITTAGTSLGYVASAESIIAREFRDLRLEPTDGVFVALPLPIERTFVQRQLFADREEDEDVVEPSESGAVPADTRGELLRALRRVHRKGWIDSKQLDKSGNIKPCEAPQCGGFTLEAELGVWKNSVGEPDFLGWEVKQHSVPNFDSLGGAITLMTPEPTGGYYKDKGVEQFIRKFGYPDKNGKKDRLNFGGIHKVGERQSTTGLTMCLVGYDAEKSRIVNPNGSIALVSARNEVAAEWGFAGVLTHWSRKHSRAVYVPSMRRTLPSWQYSYGPRVRLAVGTDSLRLLQAIASGSVYYDPGIKLENASTRPTSKRRSQFRISSKQIDALYGSVTSVAL